MQFTVRNVNEALPIVSRAIVEQGYRQASRNGPTIEFPEPVITLFQRPRERVLFSPERDANPYLHLFESLWMLAGSNDVRFLEQFAPRMRQFADPHKNILWGAYGHRWRDQILPTVKKLQRDPTSRQAVIQLWDQRKDLAGRHRDHPCNVMVVFRVRAVHEMNGPPMLDMTVFNRSNDMIWGCYGANVVHFSYFQEYMANLLGISVGQYSQVSNSMHVYTELYDKIWQRVKKMQPAPDDPYQRGEVKPYEGLLVDHPKMFLKEVRRFISRPDEALTCRNDFLNTVAWPAYQSWLGWKTKDARMAVSMADQVGATDWRRAMLEWLARRGMVSNKAYPRFEGQKVVYT